MQYPLDIRFKLLALTNQIYLTDATGATVFFVKQKMFKLRESIGIYGDERQTELLFNLTANRVIDFSPEYSLTRPDGSEVGRVKRNGARSIWRADYDLTIGGEAFAHVGEADPWAKVCDALVGSVPVIGAFSGYLFHPAYHIDASDGNRLAELEKMPAFFEGLYKIHSSGLDAKDPETQKAAAALLMMVVLFEQARG